MWVHGCPALVRAQQSLGNIESCLWEPREECCILPHESSSGHDLNTRPAPSCHGQILPGYYFHSRALQRAGLSKLSTHLSQSRSCPNASLVLGITGEQGFLKWANFSWDRIPVSLPMGTLKRLVKVTWSRTDGERFVSTPVPLRDNLHSPDPIAMLRDLSAHPIIASTALAPAVP